MTSAFQWLRRRFLAGFFVTVPLAVSVAALVWMFNTTDGWLGPLYERWLGREVPGLGLVTTIVGLFLIGVLATNVIGRRLVQKAETYLLRVPVFRAIYSPVRQLVAAFSPDNEHGFKRVALVEEPGRGLVLGFLTREFTLDRGHGPEAMVALYLPTNHLYLGDIVIYPRARVDFPDITVQQGIRIFLTGGMSLPSHIQARRAEERRREDADRRRA